MIFVYSVGYHNYGQPAGEHDQAGLPPHGATMVANGHKHTVPSVEPMYSRFFAFISLFAFGMFTLVVSDNLLTLFAGWEIMGLCSYLLIGFWYAKPVSPRRCRQSLHDHAHRRCLHVVGHCLCVQRDWQSCIPG